MLDLFAYDFMQRAFIAGLCIAVLAPSIGVFLVSKRYAFMADTLAHVSLAGVAVGILTNTQPVLVAMVACVATALFIEELRIRRQRLPSESILSLFLSGGLALASVLLSISQGVNISLSSVLFGSITTVTQSDVVLIVILSIVVLVILLTVGRKLFAVCLDEELAIASGLPVHFLSRLLVVMAAVTVSLTMRIVGVLLVGALMVIPSLTGQLLARSFRQTLIIAIICALISVIGGLFLSYFIGTASGGTIVLLALGLFLIAAAAKKVV